MANNIDQENLANAVKDLQNVCSNSGARSQLFIYGSQGYKDSVRHWLTSSSEIAEVAVQPGSAADLGAMLQILGKWKIPFAIKSGGHATSPKISSTRGVQIYMVRFSEVKYDPKTQTVDVGAGCLFEEVYRELDKYDRNVVGGSSSEGVGVAGWYLGGGYSFKSNQYGLGIDNVVKIQVVLPKGNVVEASDYNHEFADLFEALKGGGNNFGVVTQFTLKTYPQTATYGGRLTLGPGEWEQARTAVANFIANERRPQATLVATYLHDRVQGTVKSALDIFCIYDGLQPAPDDDPFKELKAITISGNWGPDPAGWGLAQPLALFPVLGSFHQPEHSPTPIISPFGMATFVGLQDIAGSRFDLPGCQRQRRSTDRGSIGGQTSWDNSSAKEGMSGVGEVPHCGRFACITVSNYTKRLIDTIEEESKKSARLMGERRGVKVTLDIWPFMSTIFNRSTPSAWPHPKGDAYGPCIALFTWEREEDSEFWIGEMNRALEAVRQVALQENCTKESYPIYQNTALNTTSVKDIFRGNLDRLRQIRAKYDPQGLMSLAAGFRIPLPTESFDDGNGDDGDVDTCTPVLRQLSRRDIDFMNARRLFVDTWRDSSPQVRNVYRVEFPSSLAQRFLDKYDSYRTSKMCGPDINVIEKSLFHGPKRTCKIVQGTLAPCARSDCAMCHILRCAFTSGLAKKSGRWGYGIYTTPDSYKAVEEFAQNNGGDCESGLVLLSKIVTGTTAELSLQATQPPPPGYDSITNTVNRGRSSYTEVVVFRDEAICPWIVIEYGP